MLQTLLTTYLYSLVKAYSMALEFMDVQEKDNALYGLLIAMSLVAFGIAGLSYYYVSLLIMSLVGFTIAIHLHKEKMESMGDVVCPIGEHCYDVITSKYSEFLGISVEIYGMLYYGLIFTGYIVSILFAVPEWFVFFLLANTALAVLFSAYLTWIQAVPLGQWCIWCVTSAICCITIFAFALLGLSIPLNELLAQFQAIPHTVYVFSIALGMGVALAGDALFLDFLRNFEMSETQAKAINTLYELMWASLAFLVLGGVGYFYPTPELLYVPTNTVAILAIGVLIANGLLMYLFTSHKLEKIKFRGEKDDEDESVSIDIKHARHRTFLLTGISAASWIALFLLTFARIPSQYMATHILLTGYLVLIAAGIFGGSLAEFILKKSAQGKLKSNIPLLFD